MADIIDIDVFQTVTSVSFEVEPNTNIININKVTIEGTGGGATNLSPTQTATNFTINSDTGTDATIPLGNGTLAGATLNDYTTAEKNKLGKYPSTATNGKILQGNGTSYVEIDTPTGTTNLGYTPSPTNGTVTSSTGDDATIPLADGTNAGLFTPSEKNKLAGIATGAEVNVNADWNAASGDAQILNKPTIPSITNLVPYTGATTDVDLGLNDITAAKLIKDGGFDYQFLKADGSVDNNIYLTSADLPSTLDLYATTTASDISGYTVLVRNIADTRYNATAQDVSTDAITTINQLVGSLVSDANTISGNPGIFNFTTIGNIRRISGSGEATFYFRIYKRDSLGVETFITQSDNTIPVIDGSIYVEFSAVALWNDGIFLDTDRIVLKYYANRISGGSDPTYQFQFGGTSPVRSSAAIPTSVMPNIYLRDLADVENVDALNNEILYWNDPASLWEHSLAEDLVPLATAAQKGLVSTTTQTFAGDKTFTGTIGASNLSGTNTGDETITTIKTKLGITTLSGSNTGDQNLSGYALLASPAFTGNPTATTQTPLNNSTRLATTAYVEAACAVVAGASGVQVSSQDTFGTNKIATVTAAQYAAFVTAGTVSATTLYFITA